MSTSQIALDCGSSKVCSLVSRWGSSKNCAVSSIYNWSKNFSHSAYRYRYRYTDTYHSPPSPSGLFSGRLILLNSAKTIYHLIQQLCYFPTIMSYLNPSCQLSLWEETGVHARRKSTTFGRALTGRLFT